MDHVWLYLIQITFHISFFIGVSYFRKGKYLLLDVVIFLVAIVWFGGCTIRMSTIGLVFNKIYLKMCVIYWCMITVNIVLFLSLINFRFKNNQIFKLISLNRKLSIINLQIPKRRSRRHFVNAIGVIVFHILSGTFFLYWEQAASNVISGMYDKLCARTLSWPTTVMCIQFSCWVQIFAFNFEVVLEKIRRKMTSAKQTKSKWLSVYALARLNNELKMVMRLKQAITDSYGSSIIFNQLYTFICLLLNCTLLTANEFGKDERRIGWFRCYLWIRIIYFIALSYIPHWIGQIAFSEVSRPHNRIVYV